MGPGGALFDPLRDSTGAASEKCLILGVSKTLEIAFYLNIIKIYIVEIELDYD